MADLQPRSTDYNLIKPNFTAGELSPRLAGRVDLTKYYEGVDTLENFLIYPQGGIYRRPGTRYVVEAEASAANTNTVLIPFRFSATQNYVTEFNANSIRFYRNGGQIQSGGNAVEIANPYLTADVGLIKWAQSADTLYLAHSTYWPQKLTRTSDTVWTLTQIDFHDGPYRDANTNTAATLAPSITANAAGKAITDTADNGAGLIRVHAIGHGYSTNDWVVIAKTVGSGGAYTNGYWKVTNFDADHFDLQGSSFVASGGAAAGGTASKLGTLTAAGTNTDGTTFAPFVTGPALIAGKFASSGSGHVGSSWRFSSGGTNYGWCKIVNVNSTTVCVIDIRTAFDATTASGFWREGAWSGVRGYPGCCLIKDQRLIFANWTAEPQKMAASRVNNYEDFIPQFVTGTTSDSDAWVYQLGTSQVNAIQWMADSARGLLVGTVGEEQIGSAANGTGPITPNSVWFRVQTHYGSLTTALPAQVGFETLFVTKTGFKLRAASYSLLQDVYIAPDRTLYSEHISYLDTALPGFNHMVHAQEPNSDIWLTRNDGTLVILTYLADQNIAGWSRHFIDDGDGAVISLACIPSTNLNYDQVWMVVNRIVAATPARHIAYVDCKLHTDLAVTVDNTATVTVVLDSVAPGTGVTATADSAVFDVGMIGSEIVALPAPSGFYYPIPGELVPIIPGYVPAGQTGGSGRATITAFTDSTHVTVEITNAFAADTMIAGEWGIGSFSFSGLSHLKGSTVNVIGDGAVYPDAVVDNSGAITLGAGQPSIVQAEIGLPFTSSMRTMRPDPKSGGETIQTDRKRWAKLKIRVQDTTVLMLDGVTMEARDLTMAAGVPPGGLTGDMLLPNASFNDYDGYITISQPYPVFTAIHAIFGRLETGPV